MFKKAQGLPITTIIVAVIGLIVLVVIVAVLTGKLGSFSKGIDKTNTCAATCNAVGADGHTSLLEKNCADTPTIKHSIMPGKYGDITLPDNVCCCKWGK